MHRIMYSYMLECYHLQIVDGHCTYMIRYELNRLQLVQNTAASLVFGAGQEVVGKEIEE